MIQVSSKPAQAGPSGGLCGTAAVQNTERERERGGGSLGKDGRSSSCESKVGRCKDAALEVSREDDWV